MPHPLYKDPDQRNMAVTAAAGVALHAMVAGNIGTVDGQKLKGGPDLVAAAFDIAELFIAEAERRFGP
jgi:hypothetical protein